MSKNICVVLGIIGTFLVALSFIGGLSVAGVMPSLPFERWVVALWVTTLAVIGTAMATYGLLAEDRK